MNELKIALANFWGALENIPGQEPKLIPALEDGLVPEGQPFPYITYPVIRTGFGGQAILTVSVWDKDLANPGFQGRVDHVLGQISERVTEEGTVITLGNNRGIVWLNRNGANFISYMDDPGDKFIVRGIVHLQIKAFSY